MALPKPPTKTGHLGGKGSSYGGGTLATTGIGATLPLAGLALLLAAAVAWRRTRVLDR